MSPREKLREELKDAGKQLGREIGQELAAEASKGALRFLRDLIAGKRPLRTWLRKRRDGR